MKCILMNKNTEVLVAEYDNLFKIFNKIIEIRNIEYAPLILKNIYEKTLSDELVLSGLSEWFKGRGIPSWRDKLDLLLHRLNVESPVELLDKAFGLSLSDQYWIKPYNSDICYADINFFDNDFDSADFLDATFTNSNFIVTNEESLKTPNNTTDGMLKKTWIIDNGIRYLLKGGYRNDVMQPFNEVLASSICKRLDFSHVTYNIDVFNNKIVSKCPCLINKDMEIITAYQIIHEDRKHKSILDYENYIKKLEDNGIKNAREELENMYILDFLIMNEDRHLNNFGIIRDVNTLEWISVCPIFDNGQSLNVVSYDDEVIITEGEGRLFYEVKSFDFIIKIVRDIKRIDISKLDGLVEEFDELLHKYQDITHMSDRRINKLCILLNRQINKLRKLIEE